MSAVRVVIRPYDVSPSIDPSSIGETSGRHVNRRERAIAQRKPVLNAILGDMPPDNLARRRNAGSLGVEGARKINGLEINTTLRHNTASCQARCVWTDIAS